MSTLKATTLSNLAGDKTISTDRIAQGTAAAWVNFNGTGTVAIRASYNVSSITDNGAGSYTVNFASPVGRADFSVACSVSGLNGVDFVRPDDQQTPRTTGLVRLLALNSALSPADAPILNATVFC